MSFCVLIWRWEKGGSQSSPQAVRGEKGREGLPAGTEGGAMSSSLARSLTRLSFARSHTDTHLNSLLLRPDTRDKDRRVNSSGAVCPHCSRMSISLKSLALFSARQQSKRRRRRREQKGSAVYLFSHSNDDVACVKTQTVHKYDSVPVD